MSTLALTKDTSAFEKVLAQLIKATNADQYDPFKELVWPESLKNDKPWMSSNLMSISGTRFEQDLSEEQKIELSKWEFVNFCSLNVTGIRELLVEMTGRLHTSDFELISEYLHHLIAEENEHMWYFSKFCLQYGGKIYPDRALAVAHLPEADIANFMLFTRILIFEEIVDFYNRRMGKDTTLPEFVQQMNWLHHMDEGRHITYGRLYVDLFYQQLKERYPEQRLQEIEAAVKAFMQVSVLKLYRREMYMDAGLEQPGKMRKELLVHPARYQYNTELISGTAKFFTKIGLFSTPDVLADPTSVN